MADSADQRRPLKTRGTRWAAALARLLTRKGVRPNSISVLSIVCASATGACLLGSARVSPGWRVLLFVAAAGFIQLRLLCNMLDGMVAVEGGLGSKSGEIYNELPDRISDALALVCAGYACGWTGWEPELGWAAAVLAVITAYVRALGSAVGASPQFCGPMAKPQRMFVLTLACLAAALEVLATWPGRALSLALILVNAGCVLTIMRRTVRIVRELEAS